MKMHSKFGYVVSIFSLAFLLAACDNSNENREEKIVKFFKGLEAGTNPDYAVVKLGPMDVPNPTIVIYGYIDNKEVCQEIIGLFNKTEKGAFAGTYHCEALNISH